MLLPERMAAVTQIRGLLSSIGRGFRACEWGLALVGGIAILGIMLLTTLDVVLRKWFNYVIPGGFSLVEFLMAGAIFLGLAYVQRLKGNVAIEMVVSRLSPRMQGLARLLGYALALLVFGVITWKTGEGAYDAWVIGDHTTVRPHFPTWPARAAVPVGCGMLCIRLLIDAAADAASLLGRHFRV